MRVNKEVTVGNLVSWGLILMGFAAGYQRLQGSIQQADERAKAAEMMALAAQTQAQTNQVVLAEIRTTTKNIEKNVDEIRAELRNDHGNRP